LWFGLPTGLVGGSVTAYTSVVGGMRIAYFAPHASRASKKFRLNEGGVSTQDPRLCRLLRPLDFRKEYFHPIFEVVVGGALLLPTLDRKLGAVQIENGPP